MRGKKLILIIIFFIIIMVCVLFITQNREIKKQELEEITPGEEISDEQARKTIVTLYFKDKETGELSKEARSIDVKLLAEKPYEELIKMLIEGPQSSNLEKIIPEGTRINEVKIEGNVACVDLSKEFINNHKEGLENESKTIYSIVNTLTELNEISFVRIIIDGKEDLEFKDSCINFKENFEKND